MENNEKGITLIALVITIIILLILVSISITEITGENGILTKAHYAKQETLHANVKSKIYLAYSDYRIERHSKKTNITFIQFLQNKGYVTEPASDTILTKATLSPSLVEGMSDHGTFVISMVSESPIRPTDTATDMVSDSGIFQYASYFTQPNSCVTLSTATLVPVLRIQQNITAIPSDRYTLVCNSVDHAPEVIWTNSDNNGSSDTAQANQAQQNVLSLLQ